MFKDALVHRDKHSLCSRLKRSITDLPLLYSFINVKHYLFIGNRLTAFYYPTLLRRVQITRDICTRLIPPTARKIKNLDKSEFWGNENVG